MVWFNEFSNVNHKKNQDAYFYVEYENIMLSLQQYFWHNKSVTLSMEEYWDSQKITTGQKNETHFRRPYPMLQTLNVNKKQ